MKTSGFSENTRMAKRAYEIMINDIDEGERIFENLIFQYGDDGMFYYQRGLAYKHWYEKTKNGEYREKAIYDFSQAYKFFPSPIWKEKAKKEIESLEPKLKIDEIIEAVKQERARIENKKNRQPYFVFGLIELYEEKVGDEDFIYFVFENYHERIQIDMREERESYDFKFGDRFLKGQLEFEEDKLKVIIPAGKNSLDSKEIEKLKEIADREGIYYISDFRKNIEKLAEFLIEKRYENNRYLDYFFNIEKTPHFSGFSGIINELIEENLNESQIEAIKRACFQDITFIWGPPGTGKTEVLCNILNIFYRNGYRTLVISLSNSAVDELLKKFISKFQYEKEEIIRLGDERPQTPIEIRGFFSKKIPPYAKIVAGNFNNIFYRKKVKPFDFILIDEVSMTPIPNIVAISYLAEKGLILAGDPAQLPPPYPKEMERPNEWFSKNVFEKIGIGAENIEETLEDRRCVFLDTQYRMAEEINELVSELFYEGKLKCGKKDEVLNLNKRVFFIDSHGKIEIGPEIVNRRNEPHAKAIVNYIEKLLEKLDKPLKIGIITPYNAQVCTIYKYLKEKQLLEIIKTGTVHIFQGKEYDIIFFDIPDIDIEPSPLITDKKLLNVALSRAREALIIIGDKNYLLSPHFFDEKIREIYRKIIEKGEKISGDVKWIDVM
jgi:hypothetical protein